MNLTHDWIGVVHLTVAIIALLCGTLVLYLNKGTVLHKRIGYIYAVSMLGVVITAFGIYRLFKGFGPFHGFAIMAIVSLALGMIPMLKKEKTAKAITTHYSRMYWSVIGLYAAFAAETFVRLPGMPFWNIVIFSTVGIMAVGFWFFRKYVAIWENRFVIAKRKKTLQTHTTE